jgi:hypothetical protein
MIEKKPKNWSWILRFRWPDFDANSGKKSLVVDAVRVGSSQERQ